MSEDNVRANVSVRGRVQGVGFRYWTSMTAQSFGLTGWVKNTKEGGVKAVFEGPRESIEEMLSMTHSGPPSAKVDDVTAEMTDASGEFQSFEILR